MKCNRIFLITLALVVFGFLAVNSAQATNWTVIQLTYNSYDDHDPQIYGSNVVWRRYDGSDWEIFLATATMPGDVNGDGFVGGDDLSIILASWGLNDAARNQGDLSGDGLVGGADYTEVLENWGSGTPPEAIPEPATLGLLAVGGVGVLGRQAAGGLGPEG